MRTRVALGVLVVLVLTVGLGAFVARASFDEPLVDFADHAFPAMAWTGDRLLVYGGADNSPERYSNAAALIDPTSGEQDLLPNPPFDGALAVASLAADDRHALVLGWLCSDPQPDVESCPPATVSAARLDLRERTWSAVEVPDELADVRLYDPVLGVTSDGRAVFRFGGAAGAFWTFDLAEGEWAPVPFDGPQRGACLAGDRLVVNTSLGRSRSALAVRSLTGGDWTTTRPVRTNARTALSCAGDVALLGALGEAPVRHSLVPEEAGGPWEPAAPAPSSAGYGVSVWTGERLVVLNRSTEGLPAFGPGLAYDPAADRWSELVGAPASSDALVWADGALVGFAQDADSPAPVPPMRLVRYVPRP